MSLINSVDIVYIGIYNLRGKRILSGKYVLRVRRKEGVRVRMMKATLFEVLSMEELSH